MLGSLLGINVRAFDLGAYPAQESQAASTRLIPRRNLKQRQLAWIRLLTGNPFNL